MAKEVDLLGYWMPLLRKLKEFQEIAKAEEPELRYILAAIDRTLANMFIETADESGIKRFESLIGIVPEDTDTLEIRRFRVLTKWNNYVPYTKVELYRRLVSICGSEDAFDLDEHYEDYWLKVTTRVNVTGAFEMIVDALSEMLPCNLVLELENILEELASGVLYVGMACNTAFRYIITHDIHAEDALSAPMHFGEVAVKAGSHIITHDVSLRDAGNMSLYTGLGAGMAHTRLITQDIRGNVLSSGNSKVATSANVATIITLN